MKNLKKYIKVWLKMTSRAAQSQLLTSWAGALFIIGKIVRFLIFFVFLFTILSSSKSLAGLNKEQVIFFFLVFNLVDVLAQVLFRGVYQFRFRIVSGNYDLDLLKPLPSSFSAVFRWTDILDIITLVPLSVYIFWFVFHHQLSAGVFQFFIFLVLMLNSLVISFAFHLFVCAVGVITLEIDHLVWVYRDLTSMARFPTDIYQKGIRFVLTFTIPVVVLITVPAKALLGVLSWPWILLSLFAGGVFLWASLRFWRYALRRYSSASS
ncbi:ABC transporter permease [Patescibacteria group bacterium]